MSRVEEFLDFADKLPSMPTAVVSVLRAINDESADNERLAAAVSKDQALVAKLLKLSNSAYYGVSRRVSTVKQALLVLGRNGVRSLVIAIGAQDTLARPQPGYLLDRGALWQAALASGVAASVIGARVQHKPADEAFVAGMLHDVGKVVLSHYLEERAAELMDLLAEVGPDDFAGIERRLVDIDHAMLGGLVAEHWQLPDRLVQAIRYHHRPTEAGDAWPLATIVHTANALTMALGVGLGIDGLHYAVDGSAIERLGLDGNDLELLADQIGDELARGGPL